VVTDPPYDDKTHKGERSLWSSNGRVAHSVTFGSLSSDALVEISRELVRVSRGYVVATVDWRHMHALEEAGLLIRFGVWTKPRYTPQISGDRPATGWEAIAIMHRPGRKKWNGGGKSAVYSVLPTAKRHHPTEKPIELITKFLELYSNPGATVFDPFMGSGTTGVACAQTGRNFMGCEIDPGYFEIAQRRIAEAQQQPALLEVA
jgi:site-specific DNA-methyltransferase (adenine-specific)